MVIKNQELKSGTTFSADKFGNSYKTYDDQKNSFLYDIFYIHFFLFFIYVLFFPNRITILGGFFFLPF